MSNEWDDIRQQVADRNAHLRSHGFSETFTSGGTFGGTSLTSCLTCGSVVALTPVVEGETHPLDLHKAWHRDHDTRVIPPVGGDDA